MRELRRGKSSRFQRRHGVCSMPTRHIPKPLGRRRMRRLSKIPLCTTYGLHWMPIVSTRQGRCSWRGDMQPRDRWQLFGSGQQLCSDRMPTWLRVRWRPADAATTKGILGRSVECEIRIIHSPLLSLELHWCRRRLWRRRQRHAST